ncbi:hypothetical protein PHJA_000580000 [Phtheirospermum japonicum]|uniref:Uncharacterized protein n=1 Tax=Phtheirospermum japonicum TaxID=374723 RepID=A0A830BDX0_9LAMI|nr:hypothetical protein PHJA_000580000 [Phtheirospermum japonicum]
MAGERKGFFFEDTPGNRSSGYGAGPVAQRIRARGYEPRCRGFESLLAHNQPKREVPFPLGRKIIIGIADQRLWNLGVGLWNAFFFLFIISRE